MKTRLVWIFGGILILFFHTNCGNALAANEQRQVVILFAEGLSFSDLEKLKRLPPVDKWIGEAAAGALSMRTPGPRTAANGYLLMGSGTQALYTERSGTAYHPQEALSPKETAGERMQELGGYQAQDLARSAIVFPGIFRLHEDNRDKPYSSRLGLLGTTLAAHKIRVASYGNGDVEEVRQRHAVLFAMDQEGRVPAGDVSGKNTLPAQGYPYGVKTNYDYLREQIRADRTSGLIAVQLSDLSRLYQLGPDMEPGQFARQYQRVLHDLAQFLDELLSVRGKNQLVMLVSPAVNPAAAKEKALLSPLLSWSGEGKGLLSSATTRQSGLVSGLDVLPTVLSWLDVPVPKGLAGHVMHSVGGGTLPMLLHQVENIHHTYATRSSVLYTYVMLQIVTLAFAALLWLWGRRKEGAGLSRLRRGVRLALLALLWFPFLLLAESLLDWRVHGSVILGAIIMAGLAAAFWQENHSFARITLTTSAVTVAALLLDGWSGATLMRQSFLGYDPVIGARFYGLGNEYEGVLIGGTIMLIASLYQLYREKSRTLPGTSLLVPAVSVAICAVVLYYMVAPDLGTDAGGFLAGLVGFFCRFFPAARLAHRQKRPPASGRRPHAWRYRVGGSEPRFRKAAHARRASRPANDGGRVGGRLADGRAEAGDELAVDSRLDLEQGVCRFAHRPGAARPEKRPLSPPSGTGYTLSGKWLRRRHCRSAGGTCAQRLGHRDRCDLHFVSRRARAVRGAFGADTGALLDVSHRQIRSCTQTAACLFL
ncbi:hypothetical protein [Brevibacillus gelatini]